VILSPSPISPHPVVFGPLLRLRRKELQAGDRHHHPVLPLAQRGAKQQDNQRPSLAPGARQEDSQLHNRLPLRGSGFRVPSRMSASNSDPTGRDRV
jgi:hypothetical protein